MHLRLRPFHILIGLCLSWPGVIPAQDKPPAASSAPKEAVPAKPAEAPAPDPAKPGAGDESLSVDACLRKALDHNLDVKISRVAPQIAEAQIEQANGAFDWSFYSSTKGGRALSPTASFLSGVGTAGTIGRSESRTWTNALGLKRKFDTGTAIDLAYSQEWQRTNSTFAFLNPSWRTSLGLTLSQPLLKGGWRPYNEAPIVIAERTRRISLCDFERGLTAALYSVEEAYWKLVAARRVFEVKGDSLKLAEDLLKVNQARVRAGAAAPIEELQAEAGVASQREGVLLAENAVLDATDVLRRLMEPVAPSSPDWDRRILPADAPDFKPAALDLHDSLAIAFDRRPEIHQQKLTIENSKSSLLQAENQLKPSLSLDGSYGVAGLGDSVGDSHDVLSDGGHPSWSAGLTFELPLGNHAARGQWRRADYERRQAELRLENLKSQVIVEVRSAFREIETTQKRIEATRKSVELAQRQLAAEQKRLELGASTSHQVLDFQEDLTLARSNEIQALIDHRMAVLKLQRATGTLLEAKRIAVR